MGPGKSLKNKHLEFKNKNDSETLCEALSVLINIFTQVSQGKKLNPRAKRFSKKFIHEFKNTYDILNSAEEKRAAKIFYFKKYVTALKEKNSTERKKKIDQIIDAIDASGINNGPLSKHHRRALHADYPFRGNGKSSPEALALTRIEDLFFSYSSSQYYRENKRWDEVFESISSFYGAELDPISVFSVLLKDIFGLTGSALAEVKASLVRAGVRLDSPANSGRVALSVFRFGENLQDYAMKRRGGTNLSLLTGVSSRKR